MCKSDKAVRTGVNIRGIHENLCANLQICESDGVLQTTECANTMETEELPHVHCPSALMGPPVTAAVRRWHEDCC